MYCAVVAPTLPAPTTVTFGLIFPPGSDLDFSTFTTRGHPQLPALRATPSPCRGIGVDGTVGKSESDPAHVLHDGGAELGALDLAGPIHEAGEVVRHDLLADRGLQALDDAVGGV